MIEKEDQQETVIQGPGSILKQARERINLSSQDIADKMKLKKVIIEDIEQDTYDINISLTFVRGYLKLYAKHVYVDETEILNAFEQLNTQKKEPAKLQSFSRRVANQANDDKLMLVTYLIVAVVIALVVIWWFQQSTTDTIATKNINNNPQNNAQTVIEDATPQDIGQKELLVEAMLSANTDTLMSTTGNENLTDEPPKALPAIVQLKPVINQHSIDNQPNNPEIVDDISSMAVSINATATTDSETAAPVELIFEFSGDCWMNLSDATGENIAYGVKVKGRVMPVTGIPPFIVTLGAPEVVKIHYSGEPLDMSFLPVGRIAKFDLPLSE